MDISSKYQSIVPLTICERSPFSVLINRIRFLFRPYIKRLVIISN